ncbi:ferritin-like domain-containing protein [Undibacterium sp. TS12]|uniref:ferritin-like domain-containing protein n=1 Tax=Undibacterium sp. TS12 TaxID=2908202 RepID=UPI001F4C845F|nr:ferritin-like domain-containing protein [Undibacterium sp. TS12]MCH8621638.1 ferritin-like domain-containing protein [Undibacterium sp. TS12]
MALTALLEPDPGRKCAILYSIDNNMAILPDTVIAEPAGIPGRLPRPELVPPGKVGRRAMHTVEGRAVLLHALAHIELNAVNLAADILWRFAGMPVQFYLDWLKVAKEEAYHFQLLEGHLHTQGYAYGDFSAHNSLWEMAEKTRADLLARLALVPRTLEARGLDATPAVMAKLAQAGDQAAADILAIILRDEVGHVAIGNFWYKQLCAERGLDVVVTYAELAQKYKAPPLRGPFNLEARRAAGFDDRELQALQDGAG